MRLWSIHPKYLDSKGLVALWREALLAKKVLAGRTVGYTRHPQLERFKKSSSPTSAIQIYLQGIWVEAHNRGYLFNASLIGRRPSLAMAIPVTAGQVQFEVAHLMANLEIRDPKRLIQLAQKRTYELHPIFKMVEGPIESFERGHIEKKG